MYSCLFKRIIDGCLALLALIFFSPIIVVLTVVGGIAMKGSPFFLQERPGLHDQIFKIIKFRTMSDKRDRDGVLLSDEKRINRFGQALRRTSLDELPELINILKGDMSFVGPRPLLVRYLPYYTEEERRRHSVRPGLTGLAQINGRNNLDWDKRLALDIEYIENISFWMDMKIVFLTVQKVLKRSDIVPVNEFKMQDLDKEREINADRKIDEK